LNTTTSPGYLYNKDFRQIVDTQMYYKREQRKNFAAVKSQVRLPIIKQEYCDNYGCTNTTKDNGEIKTVYIRNTITNQLIEQHLCRNCSFGTTST
jgi:hypothetical protein